MLLLTLFLAIAEAASVAPSCTPEQRVKLSKNVGLGYNAPLGMSKTFFDMVPWGSPDRAGPCVTTIIPNGLDCAIPVATTGAGTEQFALETRQVFYHLNDTEVIPFDNGTVLYSVNIQLGVRDLIPAPVNFHGYVYMDFNTDCRIYSARAYADVPNEVLGQLVSFALPGSLTGPACANLPVGGKKREVLEWDQ